MNALRPFFAVTLLAAAGAVAQATITHEQALAGNLWRGRAGRLHRRHHPGRLQPAGHRQHRGQRCERSVYENQHRAGGWARR
jgi:hypothetical protein